MELSRLSESLVRPVPAIRFPGPLHGVAYARPRGISTRTFRRLLAQTGLPLSGFDPLQRPLFGAASSLRSAAMPSVRALKAPPMRFFAPPANITVRIGILPGSTRTPSPFNLSQVLGGLILVQLRGPVSCRCRSWGFHRSSRLFPAAQLYEPRRLAIPSRRFHRLATTLAPKGLCCTAIRTRQRSISSVAEPMPSRASDRLRGLLISRSGSAPHRSGKPRF